MKQKKLTLCLLVLWGVSLQGLYAQKGQAGGFTLTDADGNVYQTIVLGKQTWMAENLATTRYNDGENIPLVKNDADWYGLQSPAYCWYNNDEDKYGETYGVLYNWYTIETGKLCPAGWHVPTDAEWSILTDYMGGRAFAGGKLKEEGTVHWVSPNAELVDLIHLKPGTEPKTETGPFLHSGFNALPGGYRLANGTFIGIGAYGYWWSADRGDEQSSWRRTMIYNKGDVARYSNDYRYGASVRCLKDTSH